MNRWRARLAELHGDAFGPPAHVQNVQNVQKSSSFPASEHFEQIEHRSEPVPTPRPDNWTNAEEEERAAVIKYSAPRAWAEALARLDPNKPPTGVPPERWLRFIDDCGRLLDAGWAECAAALGWGPSDLFGCDHKRPFARVDNMGLVWFVNGGTILALHRDGAVIETRMGARQSYRRRSLDMSRVVLAWPAN